MKRYFITVDWCNRGFRGVFCRHDGDTPSKDGEPHTTEEMDEFLGSFSVILDPQSREMSERMLHEFECFLPLAEYSGEWGMALTKLNYAAWWQEVRRSAEEDVARCSLNWDTARGSSCRWCRGFTPMTATEECDFCYELHWRIDRRPDLARAMLAKATPQGVLRKLLWIVNYVVVESLGEKHLASLVRIVGLINDCEESERAVFEFAERLSQRYRGRDGKSKP